MDPERWQQIDTLYQAAREHDPGTRAGFLEQACGQDFELRREVESLLRADEQAGSFLETREIAPSVQLGRRFGSYEVLSLLGAGGMGEVYRAHDSKLGRDVALKTLPREFARDPERLARIRHEARTLASLNHPNIAAIYGLEEWEGATCLVLELVEGKALSGPMPVDQALDYASQIAEALEAAHMKGIIHRDLKPANVKVTAQGRIKVLDFGLAKAVSNVEGSQDISQAASATILETVEGRITGTPPYMSPEQVRSSGVDRRTDVWAFGCLLYELLSGKQAFRGETLQDTLAAILGREPDWTALPPKIPARVRELLARCLDKDVKRRPQDIRDVRHALDQARRKKRRWPLFAAATAACFLLAFAFYLKRPPAISAKDWILIADFVNTTGDPVFDGTLKEGLAAQLEQSPYLNIFPTERIRDTLRYMGRSPDERVTSQIGREICQRDGVKALIVGSIAPLGSHYALTIDALNAASGDAIARLQTEAESKERVLRTLGAAATQLRRKLGESLGSIQKFDAPIEQATTPSLAALQAFSVARQKNYAADFVQAVRYSRRAVELDPNFAMGYRGLAVNATGLGDQQLVEEAAAKAFDLRGQVSERERLMIDSLYYIHVTAELDRAVEAMETATQLYPQYHIAWHELGIAYLGVAQFEKAVQAFGESARLRPNAVSYANQAMSFFVLNRFDEAVKTCVQAAAIHLDSEICHQIRNNIAFVEGDSAEMDRQDQWAGTEPNALEWQRYNSAARGQLRRAREFTRRDLDATPAKGPAGAIAATLASAESILGQCEQAKKDGRLALELARSNGVLLNIAFAAAVCGDTAAADSAFKTLTAIYPKDTAINGILIPNFRALLEARDKQQATPGPESPIQVTHTWGYQLLPFSLAYARGEVYLVQHKGVEAAAEFQKILDHRGAAGWTVMYPTAYLGLARAAALSRDLTTSRKAYRALLTFWKDADPDLPALLEAKREYEQLGVGQ